MDINVLLLALVLGSLASLGVWLRIDGSSQNRQVSPSGGKKKPVTVVDQERSARADAVREARVSLELDGLTGTSEGMAIDNKYVLGELTLQEYISALHKLVAGRASN